MESESTSLTDHSEVITWDGLEFGSDALTLLMTKPIPPFALVAEVAVEVTEEPISVPGRV